MKQPKEKTNYWFKRRRYGYGWTPTTWQGWLTVVLFVAIVLSGIFILIDTTRSSLIGEVGMYLLVVLVATLILVAIGYKKGPQPKWRWGKKADDDPKTDF